MRKWKKNYKDKSINSKKKEISLNNSMKEILREYVWIIIK